MPHRIGPDAVPALLRPGMTVYVPGVGGEPLLFADALAASPECAAGVRFMGVWLPGINRVDYAGLHPDARATAFFLAPHLRQSFEAGRISLRPLTYLDIDAFLRDRAEIDCVFLQTAPPDAHGMCSLGIANDFAAAVIGRAAVKVAHVNSTMPRTTGAAAIAFESLDYVVEAEHPLMEDAPGDDPTFQAIGRHLAGIVRDGDTLEVGIGRVQGVLPALAGHRNLSLHTGAITSSVLDLVESGALSGRDGALTTGVAYGGPALYRFVAENPRVRFAPVAETHDSAVLRGIQRFIAVNSVIEVDLLGQANAEMVAGRQISGAGGIVDFMRGARLSPGGRAVVALPATAAGGRRSRIVPALAAGTTVSVARGDMDMVVTEYGVAELRHQDLDARAHALFAIAAPAFRESLAESWRQARGRV